MSEGTASGEDVDREDGSDEDQFEEAADQVADGAAGQAAQSASALALPAWAADLLARLAAGDRLDARDQPRLQLALCKCRCQHRNGAVVYPSKGV